MTIGATASSNSTRGLFPRAVPRHKSYKVLHGHESQDIFIRQQLEHRNHHPDLFLFEAQTFHKPLQKKAWALQEYYLSPLVLQFSRNEVVWECNTCFDCKCASFSPHIRETRNRQLESSINVRFSADQILIRPTYFQRSWVPLFIFSAPPFLKKEVG
jgi:hypothetical protein